MAKQGECVEFGVVGIAVGVLRVDAEAVGVGRPSPCDRCSRYQIRLFNRLDAGGAGGGRWACHRRWACGGRGAWRGMRMLAAAVGGSGQIHTQQILERLQRLHSGVKAGYDMLFGYGRGFGRGNGRRVGRRIGHPVLVAELLPSGYAVPVEIRLERGVFVGRAEVPEVVYAGSGVVIAVRVVKVGAPGGVYAGVVGGRLQFGGGFALGSGLSGNSHFRTSQAVVLRGSFGIPIGREIVRARYHAGRDFGGVVSAYAADGRMGIIGGSGGYAPDGIRRVD